MALEAFGSFHERFDPLKQDDKNGGLMMRLALEVKNASKNYGGKNVLHNISFKIEKPGVYLIAGPNGCGKTTLLESLVGLRSLDTGSITIFSHDGHAEVPRELNRLIGILLQSNGLRRNLTVKEEMGLIKELFGIQMEDIAYLKSFLLEQYYKTKTQKLSGGTKRRLLLALSFMPSYNALILDEPASGLDTQSRTLIWSAIRQFSRDKIIVVSDHFLNQAAMYSDYIYLMNEGRIVAEGSKESLIKRIGKTHVISIANDSFSKVKDRLKELDEKLESVVLQHSISVFVNVKDHKRLKKFMDDHRDSSLILDSHAIDFEDTYFYLTKQGDL